MDLIKHVTRSLFRVRIGQISPNNILARGQNYFVRFLLPLPLPRWPCNHQNFAVGRKWNQRDIESNDLTGARKPIRALDSQGDRDPIPPIIDPDRSLKRYSPLFHRIQNILSKYPHIYPFRRKILIKKMYKLLIKEKELMK